MFYGAVGRVGLRSSVAPFTPASLFAAGEQGVWFDPSDFSTMFQDSAGTIPVTAVEQPVGLILDKSKGLALGSEAVVTGTAPWSRGFFSVDGTISASGNAVTITQGAGDSASFRWVQPVTCVVGRYYRLTIGSFSRSGGSGALLGLSANSSGTGMGASNSFTDTSGVTVIYVAATAATMYVVISLSGGSTGNSATFTGISVRELPGNHASQSTSASRPVLRATTGIDYDGTDDKLTAAASGAGTTGFLFVAGVNIDATGSTYTVWSDTGTNTGYRVRINSSNQVELAAGNGTSYTTVTTTETLSAGSNYVIAAWHIGGNLNVRLGSGAIASQAFATASAGSASFTMGMDNGAVSSQLNGKIYNAVYVKNFAGSITDVNNTITYVNGKLA